MGSATVSIHLAQTFTCSLWEKSLEHLPPIWGTADKYFEAWSVFCAVAFCFLADLLWNCWKQGAVTASAQAGGLKDFLSVEIPDVSESITPKAHNYGFSSNWHPKMSLNNRCRMGPTDYWLFVSSTNPFLVCIILPAERLHPTHGHVNAKVTSQGVVFKPLKYLFKSVNAAGNS